jgi:hypothetical protein
VVVAGGVAVEAAGGVAGVTIDGVTFVEGAGTSGVGTRTGGLISVFVATGASGRSLAYKKYAPMSTASAMIT